MHKKTFTISVPQSVSLSPEFDAMHPRLSSSFDWDSPEAESASREVVKTLSYLSPALRYIVDLDLMGGDIYLIEGTDEDLGECTQKFLETFLSGDLHLADQDTEMWTNTAEVLLQCAIYLGDLQLAQGLHEIAPEVFEYYTLAEEMTSHAIDLILG
jgi:hypothetical protein